MVKLFEKIHDQVDADKKENYKKQMDNDNNINLAREFFIKNGWSVADLQRINKMTWIKHKTVDGVYFLKGEGDGEFGTVFKGVR